jgi:hypothetical protein
MKKYIFIIAAFAMMMLPACENDIDAEIENMEGVLCLNANLIAESDTNFVHVSRTSRTKPVAVTNAVVKLYVNDNLVETVTDCYSVTYRSIYNHEIFDDEMGWINVEEEITRTDTVWGTYMLKSNFKPGDVVRVEVESGGQHVWAEDVAPRKIENPTVTHTYAHVPNSQSGVSRTSYDKATLDISFNDVSARADYYRFALYSEYYVETGSYDWLNPYQIRIFQVDSILSYARKHYESAILKDDEVYYLVRQKHSYQRGYSEYSYRSCPILSEGEAQSSNGDEDDSFDLLTSDVKNIYHVFSDNLFNNSTAQLSVADWCPNMIPDAQNRRYGSEYTDEERKPVGDFYNWTITVKLQSISEQQYYYLRALNAVKSSYYDEMSSLSGGMKVPSNVHGGSGNFSVATQTTVVVPIIVNHKPPYYDSYVDENYY